MRTRAVRTRYLSTFHLLFNSITPLINHKIEHPPTLHSHQTTRFQFLAKMEATNVYPGSSTESVRQTCMVQVVAPASLPEGFQFSASYEGRVFIVTVVGLNRKMMFALSLARHLFGSVF